MNNTICPYTQQPVSSIDSSREHIIPDALGGPNSFALKACKRMNSKYGESIDARLIGDPLIKMCSVMHGLKTRSGPATFNFRGTLDADDSEVDIALTPGEVNFRSRIPVRKDCHTGNILVRGFGAEVDNVLKRVTQSYAKKGYAVQFRPQKVLATGVRASLLHDNVHVVQGLCKIAYLTACWTIGDSFLKTHGAGLYRTWLGTEPTAKALHNARLTATQVLEADFRDLPKHFHVILCAFDGQRLVTLVRLFNEDRFCYCFTVDASDLSGVQPFFKELAVDSINKTFIESDVTAVQIHQPGTPET